MSIRILISIASLILLISCNNENPELISHAKDNDYYTEKHRPQFHFSPEANWMNDPNGMVYYDDEYHLFYQYYPDSTVWGPMHWGHAVSEDMVHWKHLPIALYPDELGYIFSGSAVVDHNNTSGFGKNGKPPMIAIFTHHNMEGEKSGSDTYQYQSIAYSNDRGRTFTKFEGNPVIPNPGIKDFRDPKVIWDEVRNQWVMVFAAYDKAKFYTSPDLKEWIYTGEFGIENDNRLWECPDLFPMTVEGSDEVKWILITSIQQQAPNGGTGTSYFVGDYDGNTFQGDPNNQKWLDYGTDNYALVTWSDIPKSDGRTLAMGWMSNWQYAQIVPTQKWRSTMTLPRTLRLHKVANDYEIWSLPVKELQSIDQEKSSFPASFLNNGTDVNFKNGLVKLDLTFKYIKGNNIKLRLSNGQGDILHFGYDDDKQSYFIDRSKAGKVGFHKEFGKIHFGLAPYDKTEIKLLAYIDHSSIELFADDGRTVMTDIFFIDQVFSNVTLSSDANQTKISSGTIQLLDDIWRD